MPQLCRWLFWYNKMLEVLFTEFSKTEDLSCGAPLNPAYSSAIISLAWGLSLFKITVSIIEEADNNSYMGCLL